MVKISDGFLRSLEKPIILWLLFRKPRHGYEIIVEFKRITGRKLKPSIVYPFLHRLEREGFANGEWTFKGNRRIRHYSLTKNGEELLQKVREVFAQPVKEIFLDLIDKKKTA
ncbi:MAG: PadR family transcriptional regulator [Candidatus Bathyarchaeia archaeon]